MRILSILVLGLLLGGCASGPTNLSSVGRYGDNGAVPRYGTTVTRQFDGTFDEVWDASRQAIARLGLFIEESDRAKGRFNGNGSYSTVCVGGPCTGQVVYGMYFKEIPGREPRVQVTAHVGFASGSDSFGAKGTTVTLVNRIVGDVQKTLATMR